MKILKKILLKLYMIWVLLVFSVFMILLLPFIILPILLGQKYGHITYAVLALWSWIFSKLTFIRYEIVGRENVDRKRSYIYTSNHTSFLDIPGLTMGIPTQFRPLAKTELQKIPVFGFIVKVATVVVDRSSGESRKKSIRKLKNILNEGISILIFPEGTQNRTNLPLQPFYDGAFRIAIETDSPIMPIVVTNAGKLMPPSTINLRPGKIKVIFGETIETHELTLKDLPFLKERVYHQMKEVVSNG